MNTTYSLPPELLPLRYAILQHRREAERLAELGRTKPTSIPLARTWHTVPTLAGKLASNRAKLYEAIRTDRLTSRRGAGRYNPAHEVFADERLLAVFSDLNIKLIDP